MEQTRALGELHIRAQLRRHQTGQMADLDAVLEHVLAVARAIAHAAEQLDQLVVDAVHVRFKDGLLAGLANLIVYLALSLFDHFLDARRMDAPVGDQLFQRDSRNLAANRVKRGDDHGLRRIVDDQIHARRGFQCADVAALAADDAALHVLVRQRHDGNRGLCHVVAGAALNRHRDDVARLLFGLILRGLLDFAHHHARVVVGFLLDALHDHVARLVLRHLRDALQLGAALFFHVLGGLLGLLGGGLLTCAILLRLGGQAIQLVLLALQAGLARVEVIRLFVKGFLALCHAALAALHLGAAVANLAIQLVLEADDLFLRFEDAFLLLLLRTALRVVQQITGIFLGAPDFLFLHVLAIHVACRTARGQRGRNRQKGKNKRRQSASLSFCLDS